MRYKREGNTQVWLSEATHARLQELNAIFPDQLNLNNIQMIHYLICTYLEEMPPEKIQRHLSLRIGERYQQNYTLTTRDAIVKYLTKNNLEVGKDYSLRDTMSSFIDYLYLEKFNKNLIIDKK